MAMWKIILIVVNVAVVIGIAVWGYFAIRKAKKKIAQSESNNA